MLFCDSNNSYQPEEHDFHICVYCTSRNHHSTTGCKKSRLNVCITCLDLFLSSLLWEIIGFYRIFSFFHFLFFSWGTPLHSLRFNPSPAEPKVNSWQVSLDYTIFYAYVYIFSLQTKDNSARVIFFPFWYSSLIQYHIFFLFLTLKVFFFSRLFKTI